MLIQVTCPHCGARGRLRDDAQGSRVLCPRCGMRFDLPARPAEAAADRAGTAAPPAPAAAAAASADPFNASALSGFYESATVEGEDEAGPGGTPVVRRTVVAVKGTREWGEWLVSASKLSGKPAAALIEAALAEWATRHGYPAPPAR